MIVIFVTVIIGLGYIIWAFSAYIAASLTLGVIDAFYRRLLVEPRNTLSPHRIGFLLGRRYLRSVISFSLGLLPGVNLLKYYWIVDFRNNCHAILILWRSVHYRMLSTVISYGASAVKRYWGALFSRTVFSFDDGGHDACRGPIWANSPHRLVAWSAYLFHLYHTFRSGWSHTFFIEICLKCSWEYDAIHICSYISYTFHRLYYIWIFQHLLHGSILALPLNE